MLDNEIALVIVTFNRSELLLETLRSVCELKLKPSKVFIIDNNSTDKTYSAVTDFIMKNSAILPFEYQNTGSNLGGAGGFEFGSRLAYERGYEWIWLADDDIEFEPECLYAALQYKSTADIIQPVRVNLDGSCAEISGVDYKINNLFRLNPKKTKVIDVFEDQWETIKIRTIPFEGPLIHRRVFEEIGFPNPEYFIFYDDLDFALRAHRAGFNIICVKTAVIVRKIKFIQSRALASWKGYFMYRNFFKVQLAYAKKPIGILRILIIFFFVSIFSLFTGKVKSIPILVSALRDALDKNFPLDQRFKP